MAGFFVSGETKVRPGNYIRYENGGGVNAVGASNGVVALAFPAKWGPLNEVQTLTSEAEARKLYGPDGVDVITAALAGGAATIHAIRVGTGGTQAKIVLKSGDADALTLTAASVGAMPLSITIRDSIADETLREAILYSDLTQIAKYTFAAGEGEPAALAAAIAAANDGLLIASGAATGAFTAVTQEVFAAGTDPTISVSEYSAALDKLETVAFNVLCVGTDDASVHALAASYVQRVIESGKLIMAVFAAKSSEAFDTRIASASAFNNAAIAYVINGFEVSGVPYDGYLAAAVIGGMLAAVPANQSLTHQAIAGATAIRGELTNSQIERAIKAGGLVITRAESGVIWIEVGISTLVAPEGNQDEGWKKLRRVKTRFELMNRVTQTVDPLIGKINNDTNGRATYMMAAQGVINAMISEGKLTDGSIVEDASNPPAGDSAWFIIAVDDIDSLEKAYITFRFRFAAA